MSKGLKNPHKGAHTGETQDNLSANKNKNCYMFKCIGCIKIHEFLSFFKTSVITFRGYEEKIHYS